MSCNFSRVNTKYSKHINRIVQYNKITLKEEGFFKKYQYDMGQMVIKSTAVVGHSNVISLIYYLPTSS
jgi:hypothetical protein